MNTKIVLTIESDNPTLVNRIVAALARNEPTVQIHVEPAAPAPQAEAAAPQTAVVDPVAAFVGTGPVLPAAVEPEAPVKKPRKPRADAGQPRGPHKTTGEPAASEPATGGGASAQTSTAAAPATPTNNDEYFAGIEAKNAAARASVNTAPPADAAPKKLTHDDLRNSLGRINKIVGLGMAACHQFITDYRAVDGSAVKRITDVPEAEFQRFVQLVDERIAKFEKDGK